MHCDLATLADGCDHLAIEASSHGLDQFRLDGIALVAAFTNLSHHLDYPAMDRYMRAKTAYSPKFCPARAPLLTVTISKAGRPGRRTRPENCQFGRQAGRPVPRGGRPATGQEIAVRGLRPLSYSSAANWPGPQLGSGGGATGADEAAVIDA